MRSPAGLPSALSVDRTLVVGVLNVTPDSFSDGGRWLDADAAVSHGIELHRRGADIVDVGGESTRPGAERVSTQDELARVVPVVRALAHAGVPVSIDTTRAEVAAECVTAGACLINDVSGGLMDPDMLPFLASVPVPFVLMHWRGPSSQMDRLALYSDVVAEVIQELDARVQAARAHDIAPERIVVDPGLGFAKTPAHNWEILSRIDSITGMGMPVLVGASRKRFLGDLFADEGSPRPVSERDDATSAVSALMADRDIWAIRVHEPRGSRDAVEVARAMRGSR